MGRDRLGQLGNHWLSKRGGSKQWCRTWFDPSTRQTRRKSLGTDDFREAERRLAEWFVANNRPKHERPERADLAAVMMRHFQQHAINLRSHATAKTNLGYVCEFFEGATVADITPERVKAFADALAGKGLSSGGVRRVLADFKAALNGAQHRQELAQAPFIDLKIAPEGQPRQRILTPNEMAALWLATDTEHGRKFLLLSLGTMGRMEAVLDLTTWSIDWKSGSIDLLPLGKKQNKKRRPVVPLVPTLRRAFANAPEGPLVAYYGRAVRSVPTIEKAIARAGLGGTRVCVYTLRHTIISEAMKRCSEPWQVERFAGHRTGSKTTERYTKFSPGYLSKAAEAVEDYFADLEALLGGSLPDLLQPSACQLRASHPNLVVEPRGIEPLTFAMPLRRSPS